MWCRLRVLLLRYWGRKSSRGEEKQPCARGMRSSKGSAGVAGRQAGRRSAKRNQTVPRAASHALRYMSSGTPSPST